MKSVFSFASAISPSGVSGVRRGETSAGAKAVKRIEVNGTELSYVERGKGEPVVFVHGALGDFRTWTSQVDALSKNYRVISYSRRYHCPNPWDGDGPDYARRLHAADLAAFLGALKLGPAHLVGHSYGGSLAALVAAEHPDLVRTLVLGEPGIFSAVQSAEEKSLLAEQKESFNPVLRLAEAGEDESAIREYLKVILGADTFDRLPPAARAVLRDNARTLAPMLRTYFEPSPFDCERARGVRAPVLLVAGEKSLELYRRIAEGLDGCFPNSELFVLPGAAHGLQMEKPQEFEGRVREFFNARRPTR